MPSETKIAKLAELFAAAELNGNGATSKNMTSEAPGAAAVSDSTMVEPADTAALLEEISEFVGRFIKFSSLSQEIAVALWIAHTHAIDAADVTPYLAVMSAEKRSGKSRLLEVLSALAARGRHTPNISEAALYRILEHVRPTLLIDEIDALFSSGTERMEALRGVINAGNRRGTPVYRCEGPKSEVREFDVFGAKVVAGIDTGALPDTIRDRSIAIRLRRKTATDQVERLLWNDVAAEAQLLRERAEVWGAVMVDELRAARPELPPKLDDRAAEGWWPLLAIADHAGGSWPAVARASATDLSAETVTDDESRGVRLLSDLRDVFADRLTMSTEKILTALNGLDEAPWGAWNGGAGLAPRNLAKVLKAYEIRSLTVRIDDVTAKGYHRHHGLEDAWGPVSPRKAVTTVTTVTSRAPPRARCDRRDRRDGSQEDGGMTRERCPTCKSILLWTGTRLVCCCVGCPGNPQLTIDHDLKETR